MSTAEAIKSVDAVMAALGGVSALILSYFLGMQQDVIEAALGAWDSIKEKVQEKTNDSASEVQDAIDFAVWQINTATENKIDEINWAVNNAQARITNSINDAVDTINTDVSEIKQNITGNINNAIDSIGEQVSNVRYQITDNIDSAVNQITDTTNAAYDQISSQIGNGINNVQEEVSSATNQITDSVEQVKYRINDASNSLSEKIYSTVSESTNQITNTVAGAETHIKTEIDAGLNDVSSTVTEVGTSIEGNIASVKESVDAIPAGFGTALEGVFAPAGTGVDELIGQTIGANAANIPILAGLVGAGTALPQFFKLLLHAGFLMLVLDEIKAATAGPFLDKLKQQSSLIAREGLLDPGTVAQQVQRGFLDSDLAYQILAKQGLTDEEIEATKTLYIQFLGLDQLSNAALRQLMPIEEAITIAQKQGFNARDIEILMKLNTQFLSVSDLIVAHTRHGLNLEYVKYVAQRQGISPESIDILIPLSRNYLDPTSIRDAYLRGIMPEEQVDEALTRLGFTDADKTTMKKLFYLIPSPSDLVRMAVREVFSPDIAEKFGQYEDFPEAFKKYAKQAGFDEFWSKAYWAAHWELPSPGQGYEMFQREIINYDELLLLLRALDIMPFWREKMIKLNYQLPTRIDLRRMYELQLIDDEELLTRLRHYGYSPDDAKLIQRYYQIEREYSQLAEKLDGRELTKSEVTQAYNAGLLKRDEAHKQLKDLYYADDDIEVILSIEDYRETVKVRDKRIKLLKEQYIHGVIDDNKVIDELGRQNLNTRELEKVLLDFELERLPKTKKPNDSDIMRWAKLGLLTSQEVYNEMLSIGYSTKYASLFKQEIELTEVKTSESKPSKRTTSKSNKRAEKVD